MLDPQGAPASLLLVLLCSGCPASETTDPPDGAGQPAIAERLAVRFVDVTAELGVDFVHRTGSRDDYPMPAIMGGGVCVFDSDGDGDLDLYFVQAGDVPPDSGRQSSAGNRLLSQGEDGRFVDTTGASGLGDTGYGMGCALGDSDNDGDLDLVVTNYGPDRFYRNRGDGTFADATGEVGLASSDDAGWSASAIFFDYDADGWLDLYVTRYVDYDRRGPCEIEGGRLDYCGPQQFHGTSDRLYHNEAGRRFRDVSEQSGITTVAYAGLGVVAADFDDDGWIDVYVANDSDPNLLWRNQGDGTFFDEAILQGAAYNLFGVAEGGMGVTAGDSDGDGDLDLFMTHLEKETNTLYESRGSDGFEDITSEVGLAVSSAPYTGFGTALFDYDLDGDLDLAVVNGAVKRRAMTLGPDPAWFWNDYAEPNQLLQNRGDGTYADVSASCGPFCDTVEVSRGFLPVDLDGDGDLDLVVTNIEGPARVYRNDRLEAEAGGAAAGPWIEIRAFDPALRRLVSGTRVTTVTVDRAFLRHAIPVGSYLSATDSTLHLGLGSGDGATRIERFEVRWPGGDVEHFDGGPAARTYELRRGEGTTP